MCPIENSVKSESKRLRASSYLAGGNADYLEKLYEAYLKDPQSVAPEWRDYFDQLPPVNGQISRDYSHAAIREQFLQRAQHKPVYAPISSADAQSVIKEYQVAKLVDAYRRWGHLHAKLDPLKLQQQELEARLMPSYYSLSEADESLTFTTGAINAYFSPKQLSLRQIQQALQTTYCGAIGFEYMHLDSEEEITWLQERIESCQAQPALTPSEQRKILQALIAAEGLEKYLGKRYVGQKRFSLEGGGSLLPALHTIVQQASQQETKEIIIGMAHRGRLNVLVNLMGKAPRDLFAEFENKSEEVPRSGDVKYHMGFSSDLATEKGLLHLMLMFNPSHLAVISPVVMGSVRARQQYYNDPIGDTVIPILIHGDAAFAGQGVIMETLNMSQTNAYKVGGCVHFIVNNQVGFTTSDPRDARSTRYCTDIAKMLPAPVFHVNGDDPEAVCFVTQLAYEYRMRFHKDVFIDLICYRRHGHNEADEPAATQPLMYQVIKQHHSPDRLYAERLSKAGVVTDAEVKKMEADYRTALDQGDPVVERLPSLASRLQASWEPYLEQTWTAQAVTAVEQARLQAIGQEWLQLPKEFVLQAQVKRESEQRAKMLAGELPLNWGCAENLAYATLLAEGYSIRMSGQDCRRGTFAHRHAALHDQKTGAVYIPLQKVAADKATFAIYDSLLSEEAVLGFEYGYATAAPDSLVIWEAQFGDFVNGAQVIIDQFLSSSEQKWGRLCGLVLLLPHGYEGGGPEHSSARLERFLQLCAQKNMQVCVPTTPAQVFHMLRRQLLRPYRKPLVVMSPKSLLRHKLAVSSLEELANGEFRLVIPEIDAIASEQVTRVIVCSGKVYYDLLEKRREEKLTHVAIIRLEQLYPFPETELRAALEPYSHVKQIVWCQEEPKNQGAWYPMRHCLEACLAEGQTLEYVGRERSASPAAGYLFLHLKEQTTLVKQALGLQ